MDVPFVCQIIDKCTRELSVGILTPTLKTSISTHLLIIYMYKYYEYECFCVLQQRK